MKGFNYAEALAKLGDESDCLAEARKKLPHIFAEEHSLNTGPRSEGTTALDYKSQSQKSIILTSQAFLYSFPIF